MIEIGIQGLYDRSQRGDAVQPKTLQVPEATKLGGGYFPAKLVVA